MDWNVIIEFFDRPAVQAAIVGATTAIRRDWRAFKMEPQPRDFNWRQFLKSAIEGAVLGALAGSGLGALV